MNVWMSDRQTVGGSAGPSELGVQRSSPQIASPAQRRSQGGFSTVFPAIHTPYYYYEVLK